LVRGRRWCGCGASWLAKVMSLECKGDGSLTEFYQNDEKVEAVKYVTI